MWLQGWDSAPEIAHKCLESWKHYNPDWDINVLDENNYTNYIDPIGNFSSNKIGKDQYADFIRTFLLEKHGGVWADSTLFCNSPLNTWLFENDFLFSDPLPDTIISNWFISKYDGAIIDVWAKYCREFLNHMIQTGKYNYAPRWHHALFKMMYNNEPEVRKKWDSYYKLSSDIHRSEGPHKFVPYERHFITEVSAETKEKILSFDQPMYKLTHKHKYTENSVVPFLFNTLL